MSFFLICACIFLATLCSAALSASETALFSLSPTQINSFALSKNDHEKRIADLVKKARDLLVTVLILNITVNILIQNLTSKLFLTYFPSATGWITQVGVPLFLTLVFGEMLPKTLAMKNNVRLALIVAPFIIALRRFLSPVRRVLIETTNVVVKILFFFLHKPPPIGKNELQAVLKSGEEAGLLLSQERTLAHGFLNLLDAQAKELMRPRQDILWYSIDDPITELLRIFCDEQCTRIPVCGTDLDTLYGIISAKAFFLHQDRIKNGADLRLYVEKPLFVPESASARTILRQLNENTKELAIVVDEYGSVAGLLAKEDLHEVVVGDIVDRRDAQKNYTQAERDVIIAQGSLELTDFADIFGVTLKSQNNVKSLGGWLVEQLHDIPKTGTQFQSNGFLFHVLGSTPTRIERIYVRRLNTGGTQ